MAVGTAMALSGCEGDSFGTGNIEPASGRTSVSGNYRQDLAAIQRPSAVEIRQAQQTLARLGYDPGPVDGVLGKKTRIAIKHFQVDEEIKVDGELTASLSARLRRASRALPAEPTAAQTAPDAGSAARTLAAAGPVYEAGEAYVYDDGTVETVSRVGPEQILWESAANGTYSAFRNFILPPISWKSGASSGENRIEPGAGEKWPPASTREVSFSVSSRAAGSSIQATPAWSGKWRCNTGRAVRVKATAGTFNTVSILCDRPKPAPGTWKKRTWYFAPSVGHYVRRTDVIHGTGRKVTVDLVAVHPSGKGWPPAARGGLDWAIQSALDSGKTGKPVEWRSSAVGAAFQIQVTGVAPAVKGVTCRRYVLERNSPDRARHFPAVACKRKGQDRWLIPGLEPDAAPPQSLKRP